MKQPIQPLPHGRGSEDVTEPRPSGSGHKVLAWLFHDGS